MSRNAWTWARVLTGTVLLGVLVWRLGFGPFLAGFRNVDGRALLAGASIALVTTLACAYRWRVVARGLGGELPLRTAVGAYYRSQFLNTTLPGGVLGDVDRAVQHGRFSRDLGLGLRAVAWERSAGQAVQAVITVIVLVALPSPVRRVLPLVLGVAVGVAVVVVLLARSQGTRSDGTRGSRWARARRTARDDLHNGLLARAAWPAVVATSALVVVGHTVTFLVAARAAGVHASTLSLLPLALLVLLAMALPTSIGGWGPREGMAAWVFAMAGLGSAAGLTTAVVYGVLVLVASLPGAVLLGVAWFRGRHHQPSAPDASDASDASEPEPAPSRAPALSGGAGRG